MNGWATIFTGILAGLATLAASWQLATVLWTRVKPRIEVRLLSEPGNVSYRTNQVETLTFEFENVARRTPVFGFKRRMTLNEISVQMFFPKAFMIRQVKRHISQAPELGKSLFEAPPTGRYEKQSYVYVFVPDPFGRKPPVMTSLANRETEQCQVTVEMPSQPGSYKILFDISSREGGLSSQALVIKVIG